jgi:hypothetical protein
MIDIEKEEILLAGHAGINLKFTSGAPQ